MQKEKLLAAWTVVPLLIGTLAVAAAGSAPIAENLELTTSGRTVVSGRLSAHDAEDDAVRFLLTTEPRRGTILLHESGEFLYSPDGCARRDYFGYRAVDSEGNESEEATVIIRISRPRK